METIFVAKVSTHYFFVNGKNQGDELQAYLWSMNKEIAEGKGFHFSKLLNYFLQGLLVIAPIAITIYAVYSVVSFIDNQVPIFTAKDADGKYMCAITALVFYL